MTTQSNSITAEQSADGVYIYVRVSTGRQVLGTGLETQERDCRAYAGNQGWTVLRVFREEGESAKTAKRTEPDECIAVMQAFAKSLFRVGGEVIENCPPNAERDICIRKLYEALMYADLSLSICFSTSTSSFSRYISSSSRKAGSYRVR